MKKILAIILSAILLISAVFIFTSCADSKVSDGNAVTTQSTTETIEAVAIGEGETSFTFYVVDTEGNKKAYLVSTNETTVGAALLGCGLIAGDEGVYGLYVKTVDGTTLDYDKDGKYWAFYVGDEMSPVGVDAVEITADASYSFKAE